MDSNLQEMPDTAEEAINVRRRASRIPYIAAAALGTLLFLISGPKREHLLTDLLFSLASGALIVGLVHLLGNMKMFASLNWGTRLLKRLVTNKARSAQAEAEDYAAYRSSRGGHSDAVPLLIASVVLAVLSHAAARLF